MISEQEVKHIAKLARLGLTEDEIKKFQREISSILDYFEKLKEVDISEVKGETQPIKIEEAAREDKINEKLKMKNEKLMKLAPETKDGYLKVKSIF
ncbi:MAG: Asp-tRNA(Asn)/Glu-tRNA(Gln) amidotransferase GatCAB subunit C [Candidatus Nealsonbacteria bacterium CG08_land_8_20_14_0_20_38_20]|uniref:Aspartyl/glutamyl-tRNA(Asn/Gln) amidotransferase subunit C n=1 Tax=Candidatus Nealsonbacteria bacterium CG08_land_8_20_14_0_20_38_20 TaxID=1974705 RepID=A0A2H0YLK9_9BACT|nr:MAG: Asp-tRNA(Asn)/Glu-tRNA(Gln) amidotransferase GatCAB subunit C [Candidatus Nealsonbacteria bacterium CG08_land_8_20_14_0_20_38_20]